LKTETQKFRSPTTPGLLITFRNYIIELVCLNVNAKLDPYFWKGQQYWKDKYKREIKGIFNLMKLINDDSQITKTAIINVIKRLNIKSLSAKKTLYRIQKAVEKEKESLIFKRQQEPDGVEVGELKAYMKKNSKFVNIGKQTKLDKLRKLENSVKEKTDHD